MTQSSSVRRDKKYCIFRTSCAIATKLEIKDHYMIKKNPNPQNSKKDAFSLGTNPRYPEQPPCTPPALPFVF